MESPLPKAKSNRNLSLQRFFTKFSRKNQKKQSSIVYKQEDFTVRSMRKIATPLVDLVEPFSFITPNRLTWFGFLISIVGCIILALASDNVFLLFIAGFSFWVYTLIDCMDGQLARKRGTSSKRGEWLDSALEEFKSIIQALAVGINISDADGYFTLLLGEFSIKVNTWFVIFILYGCLAFIILSSIRGSIIFDDPLAGSFGNVYIFWIVLVLNLLELFLVLFTIMSIITVIYVLFEKTFLLQEDDDVSS